MLKRCLLTLLMALTLSSPTRAWLDHGIRQARVREHRPLPQFMVQELVIPEGRYEGTKFSYDVQPFARLLHQAMEPGCWRRVMVTGCVQGGKSLLGYVAPAVYHICEIGEPVILFGPTIDVCKAKWSKEILPAFLARRKFAELLPARGAGSKGGIPEEIIFNNGARLKMMSAGGGDEKRSSYTARVVVATEIDKCDRPGESSRETSPVRQAEARTLSYDDDERLVYAECTVSIEEGAIWQEYLQGTASRIVVQCEHCREWSTPEREQLAGWQGAATKQEARRNAYWLCPHCGATWSDADRRRMNHAAKLLHRGQSIDTSGEIHGEPPDVDTLSFRWNAFNNMFWSTGSIAAAEWQARQAIDEDEAERMMRQFYWALPHQPPRVDLVPLDAKILRHRKAKSWPRGLLPEGTRYLTIGADLGKYVGWYFVAAWYELEAGAGFRAHVADYGTIEIPSADLGVEIALPAALRDWRERIESAGWLQPGGTRRLPDQVWIDARYQTDLVLEFCREAGNRYRPTMGFGFGQQHAQWYNRPKSTGATVKHIGNEYHVIWDPNRRVHVLQVNSDFWKSFLQERLAVPIDPLTGEVPVGAMTLYESADSNEHNTLVKHLTAEKPVQETIAGRGLVTKWVREGRRANHYLDCGYEACAAAHLCGVRIGSRPPIPSPLSPATDLRPLPALGPGWRPNLPKGVMPHG